MNVNKIVVGNGIDKVNREVSSEEAALLCHEIGVSSSST